MAKGKFLPHLDLSHGPLDLIAIVPPISYSELIIYNTAKSPYKSYYK